MGNFSLAIKENKETLITPDGEEIPLALLEITNAFLKAMREENKNPFPKKEERVQRALLSFTNMVLRNGREDSSVISHFENPSTIHSKKMEPKEIDYEYIKTHDCHSDDFDWSRLSFNHLSLPDYDQYYTEYNGILSFLFYILYSHGKGRPGTLSRPYPSQTYSMLYRKYTPLNFIDEYIKPFVEKNNIWRLPGDQDISLFWFAKAFEIRKERFGGLEQDFLPLIIKTRTTRHSKSEKDGLNETYKKTEVIRTAARYFTSKNGLLPLIWAEIMYVIENEIYFKPCEICQKWFKVPKTTKSHNFNIKYCTEKCRREANNKKASEKRKRKKGPD